ncbi:MAG: response regulator [Planctomycetaceae bacterium]|nr:response regulator [Planctomycetaceae bacterium]
MKVGVGYSDNPETTTAGVQAVESAVNQSGRTDPCDLVLLFSTAQHDPSVLREAVVSVVGGSVPIYGGGAAGVITNEHFGYAGDQVGAACIWLDKVKCEVLTEGGLNDGEEATGIRLGKRLAELGTTQDSPVMLFYDAVDTTNGLRLMMATWLLDGLEKGLGFSPDLAGVGMIGDLTCSPTEQWVGDTIGKSNAIALVFSGDIRMDSVIIHGCRPATQYYTVTKAAGPVILEINGEPAIPFIDKLLDSAISPEQYPFFLIFGINHGNRWGEFREDAYASRLCLAIDPPSNGIVMFEPDMVEGTEFQLMFRSLELDYIKPKIDEVFERLDDREPVFGFFIDCAGRCAGYAGADREDAVFVQQAVAGRVPILGLYNGVEIARLGGRPRGLDWTGVFCLFSQSKGGCGMDSQQATSKTKWDSDIIPPSSKEVPVEAMVRISEQNAAKVLALDIASVGIRLELEYKRRGFALLAELAASLQQNTGDENIFLHVAKRINAALNMQRTVVLKKNDNGRFSAMVLQGYSANGKAALAGRHIEVPAELLDPIDPVLVTGADSAERLQELRALLGVTYFISSPVMLQGDVYAILITGRLVEAPPYLVRLSHSDTETVQALSAFLASVLAGQHLLAAEERNRIMVDSMPTCCLFWDENGNLTDCNRAALSLFELSSQSELFERFLSLEPEFQPDGTRSADIGDEPIKRAFITGHERFNYMHQTAIGTPLPVETTLIRVPKGEGYTLVGYLRDLRDQDAAAKYAKARNEFLASVSHEVRTPLNAIQAMVLAVGDIENLNESQQNLIDQGTQSVRLLTSAIETILDFSKLDSGQLSLEPVEFSINDLVESISELASTDAGDKSLYLHTMIEPDVPEWVLGDSVRLQQALFNIVMNAVKFTETGGVDIHVFREENNHDNAVSLKFEIRDTGIGISEEQMADLFKPLFSGNTTYTRKHAGLGMGLAVSKSLVTLMGGRLACESRLGEGSTFSVNLSLPVAKTKAAREETDKESLRGMRILVAEDNAINQMIIKELLSSAGIEVTIADNGLKALEKLQTNTFDLVLMDIQMPEMDGLTATMQIRSDHRFADLPILAMTANVGAEHLEESMAAGMNAHLTKPVDVNKLYGALKKWGGKR